MCCKVSRGKEGVREEDGRQARKLNGSKDSRFDEGPPDDDVLSDASTSGAQSPRDPRGSRDELDEEGGKGREGVRGSDRLSPKIEHADWPSENTFAAALFFLSSALLCKRTFVLRAGSKFSSGELAAQKKKTTSRIRISAARDLFAGAWRERAAIRCAQVLFSAACDSSQSSSPRAVSRVCPSQALKSQQRRDKAG